MLFVPPCINKFYILDLQPENSVIRYTVEQGHRTFVMSWRNPDESMVDRPGTTTSTRAPSRHPHGAGHHGADAQHAGLLRRRHHPGHRAGRAGRARRAAGAVADAADHAAGLRGQRRAGHLHRRGLGAAARDDLGRPMRPTGRACSRARNSPPPSASCAPTTWSGTTWSATTSRANRRRPSTCCTGTATRPTCPVPCTAGTCATPTCRTSSRCQGHSPSAAKRWTWGDQAPVFVYASREDHIVPWTGAYRLGAPVQGQAPVRAGRQGHIAGVINPPAKGKRSFWTTTSCRPRPQDWLRGATEHPGSWWPTWSDWLKPHGGQACQRAQGAGQQPSFKPIEPAPGRYVKAKA
jgi:polyhydroxyalkanoate synthase